MLVRYDKRSGSYVEGSYEMREAFLRQYKKRSGSYVEGSYVTRLP